MEKLFAGDEGQPVLKRLRQVRDRQLSCTLMGRTLISLYYASSDELNTIFEAHPMVAAQTKKLIAELLPAIEKSPLNSPRIMLSRSQAAAVSGLLRDLQHHASPQLRKALTVLTRWQQAQRE